MVRTSVLHDALKNINNAEKAGKRQVMIRPSSKVITKFLRVMQSHGMPEVFVSLFSLFPFSSLRNEKTSTNTPFGMITRRRSHMLQRLQSFKLPIDKIFLWNTYTFSEPCPDV